MNKLPAAMWLLIACTALFAQDAQTNYVARCANCHGGDGAGNTALGHTLKLRDLRSPEVKKLSENEVAAIIRKGTDRGRMPGFEKKLGRDAIQQLASYVLTIELQPRTPEVRRPAGNNSVSPDADTKTVYVAKCANCHGADGSGNTFLGRRIKVHDLRSSDVQTYSNAELVGIIANGMDRGRMPGFQKKLGTEAVGQLATFVRNLAPNPLTNDPPTQKEQRTAERPMEKLQPRVENQPIKSNAEQKKMATELALADSPPASNSQDPHLGKSPLLDLNSATKEGLMALPGITESDAANIISMRPFKSLLQFKVRKVIPDRTYAQIVGRITVKSGRNRPRAADQVDRRGDMQ